MATIIIEEIVKKNPFKGFRVLRQESAASDRVPLAEFTIGRLRRNPVHYLVWEKLLKTPFSEEPIDVVRSDHLPERRAYEHAKSYAKGQIMGHNVIDDRCERVGRLSCR